MIDFIKDKFLFYSFAIGTLMFILSSGGSASVRLIGLLLFTFSSLTHMFNHPPKVPKLLLGACVLFCLTFLIGVIKSSIVVTDHTAIYYLTVFLIFLIPFFIFSFNSYNFNDLNRVIKFISSIYIILFFTGFSLLFLFREQIGSDIILLAKGNEFFAGLYYRPVLMFNYYPAIWFQFSILAMPFAIWNLYSKNTKLFFLLALVVILSLNRTGSIIVVLFYFLFFLTKKFSIAKALLYFVFALPFIFFITCVVLHMIYSDNFINTESGFDIRLGHILSVFDNIYEKENFLFGMGADTSFITLGRVDAGLVQDQEISFLEVLRRFGFVGYIMFSAGLFVSLLHFYNKKKWASFYSLLAYILFSFTNPSLISMTFAVFFGIISSAGECKNKLLVNN